MAEEHWSTDARERFNAYLSENYELLMVTLKGIGKLMDSDERLGNSGEKTVGEAAREMVGNEYASLHALAVVGLWAALEAYVDDIVAHRLVEEPQWATATPDIARMRVTMGEIVAMSDWERARYIIRGIRQGVGTGGLDAFEALLAAVGLPRQGDITKARDLRELHQVRNLIVHHGSVVDGHFLDKCDWTEAKLGERWRIGNDAFTRYQQAVREFTTELYDRFIHDLEVKRAALAETGGE